MKGQARAAGIVQEIDVRINYGMSVIPGHCGSPGSGTENAM